MALLALTPFAAATTVIEPTFDELVGQAELIFQGTVTNVKSEWAGEGAQRHIVSYVTLQVDEKIKGEPGTLYTLRMMGGTVEGQTMEVTDAPKFAVGDRNILFVEKNGSQFIPLVGIMHGQYRVQRDAKSGAEFVANDHGAPVRALPTREGARMSDAEGDASDEAAVAPNEFKAAIRAQLARKQK